MSTINISPKMTDNGMVLTVGQGRILKDPEFSIIVQNDDEKHEAVRGLLWHYLIDNESFLNSSENSHSIKVNDYVRKLSVEKLQHEVNAISLFTFSDDGFIDLDWYNLVMNGILVARTGVVDSVFPYKLRSEDMESSDWEKYANEVVEDTQLIGDGLLEIQPNRIVEIIKSTDILAKILSMSNYWVAFDPATKISFES